jgi:TetR/AcrR family acrAB operon transcriptional repressor
MPPAADYDERERRILDAASRLILHYGYDKTTVADIAAEARISKGAVYLHYKSKEALFEALIFRESHAVIDRLIERVEARPDGGTIYGLYQYGILAVLENPLMHRILVQDVRVLGDFARQWSKGPLGTDSNLFRLEFVRQLQATGIMRADIAPDVLSYILTIVRYGFLTVSDVVPPEQAPPMDVVGQSLAIVLEQALAPAEGVNQEASKRVMRGLLDQMRELVNRYQIHEREQS